MSRLRRQRGFTLVELIATMVVVAVMGTVIGQIIQRAALNNAQVAMRADLYAQASAALDRIARRIKGTAARAASSPATPGIASLEPGQIVWDDGSTVELSAGAPGEGQVIRIRDVQAGDAAGGAPAALLANASLAFTAYGGQGEDLGATLGLPLNGVKTASIQRIEINLSATRDGQTVTLRTRVFLRCVASGSGA